MLTLAGWPPARHEPAIRVTELRIEPTGAKARKLVAKAQLGQHTPAVRVNCDPGADFFERGRLLVHVRLNTLQAQRIGSRHTPDSAPNNGYTHRSASVLPLTLRVALRK